MLDTLPEDAVFFVDNTCPGIVYWTSSEALDAVWARCEENGQDPVLVSSERAAEYLTSGHPRIPSEGVWDLRPASQPIL
jgi:hypothetical protein